MAQKYPGLWSTKEIHLTDSDRKSGLRLTNTRVSGKMAIANYN